ncbi:MAG: 2-deoxyribose-5-phosphate aldolase, partial [Moorea sp. SIO2B7]|nr:2-deoxyribose-5-phosphate aldolase [Moorena sp. SIO2B7]
MAVADSEIDINAYIDHAMLNPTATPQQVEQCCIQAEQFNFATVCVYPSAVRQAAELLQGKKPKVCTVIGFPS